MIGGWVVDILPVSGLSEEALIEAEPIEMEGVQTRIFTQEHLMALCLILQRPKDKVRLAQFLKESDPDLERFEQILTRHGLNERWRQYKARTLEDS